MATITNKQARLLWGPKIPGHKPPQWLPGANKLDLRYWSAAKNRSDVKRWLSLGWITVDLAGDAPDPAAIPSAADLAKFSDDELSKALKDETVPVQWHPAIEAERDSREEPVVEIEAPPPAPPSGERKSLTGLRVEEALPLIEAEDDVDTLEAWDDADKRKSIGAAIDARLDQLLGAED